MAVPAAGPFFARDRFCFLHRPSGAPRGGVLAVHAFAEEMNKTRAAVAEGARALAAAGFTVLQVDLFGCGDSAGDFGDADWTVWHDDLACAWTMLRAEVDGPCWLWGTRLGALLADHFASRCEPPADGLLLWQPVVNGAQHLSQFLRLRTVGQMLKGGVEKAPSARAELAAGTPVEIAGYLLQPALADAIESARLGSGPRTPARVHWFDVTSQSVGPPPEPNPMTAKLLARWREAGCDLHFATVQGNLFWQSVETEHCPPLVAASVAALGA